jgi:peptidoglycan/xylan/chitin deacetylase (PgdA/CDA1 family)
MWRERAARALVRAGLGPVLARGARWRGVLVLCYHRIGAPATDPTASGSAEMFDAQLEMLQRNLEVIDPEDIPEAIGERDGRFAAVTLDDGRRDAYEVAFPILCARGLPAAFFLPTGFIGGTDLPWWDEIALRAAHGNGSGLPSADTLLAAYKRLPAAQAREFLEEIRAETPGADEAVAAERARSSWITWDMAREMHRAGMRIGGHTVNHPVLANMGAATQIAEVTGCLRKIEYETGERTRLFSYPVGQRESFSSFTRRCVGDAGVRVAFSCYGGLAERRTWDPLDVPRVPIGTGARSRWFSAMTRAPETFAPIS